MRSAGRTLPSALGGRLPPSSLSVVCRTDFEEAMDMARIGVQSEELRQQAGAVKGGAAEVSDTLGRLTGQIQSLAASWEGAASAAFQTRWQEWQAGASQVQQAMDSMGIFLEEAARTYEDTEEALRAAAGR